MNTIKNFFKKLLTHSSNACAEYGALLFVDAATTLPGGEDEIAAVIKNMEKSSSDYVIRTALSDDRPVSGDGYKVCADGQTRWGMYGAAGALFIHTDENGVDRYFLQYRSPEVHVGDCYGVPGGALDRDETPIEGALREASEELGFAIKGSEVNRYVFSPASDWAYTTVVIRSDTQFVTLEHSWESTDCGWFTADEIATMNLHPGVKTTLADLHII